MKGNPIRQLLYVSSSSDRFIDKALSTILVQSRRNNTAGNLTGLLWTDGSRFLQVLEGGRGAVQLVFDRILLDKRHRAVVVLHDREVQQRTFGHWSMALMDDTDDQIATALKNADPVVRGTFEGIIDARRAA